jgi:hypothetical protein
LTFEDYDGVLDADGCHDSPGDDYDGDGFTDENEVFNVRTLPYDPDTDNDAALDGADNCPLWPNPSQNHPTWPVGSPSADADCDGFTSTHEAALGTSPTSQCPVTTGVDDAWPPDFTKDRLINIIDVLAIKPSFNLPAASNPRFDLSSGGSASIDIIDVLVMKNFFTMTCAP